MNGSWERLRGVPLINFCLFCHITPNFYTYQNDTVYGSWTVPKNIKDHYNWISLRLVYLFYRPKITLLLGFHIPSMNHLFQKLWQFSRGLYPPGDDIRVKIWGSDINFRLIGHKTTLAGKIKVFLFSYELAFQIPKRCIRKRCNIQAIPSH